LQNANEIAERVADNLITFSKQGYFDFHLVGFSLGAQIVGIIGRKVREKTSGRLQISRITGLDPGQLPPINIGIENLNSNDAKFVDIIHAETKYFASAQANGHVIFWVNGGEFQPTCNHLVISLLIGVCSHLKAPKYWIESVESKDSKKFVSYQCDSYQSFLNGACTSSQTTNMGLYVNQAARGNFYLKTNLSPPYSIST
jgi:Lipase